MKVLTIMIKTSNISHCEMITFCTSVFCTTYGEKGGMGGWRKRAAEAELGEAEEGSSVPLNLNLSLDTEKFGNYVCGAWWQLSDGARSIKGIHIKAGVHKFQLGTSFFQGVT